MTDDVTDDALDVLNEAIFTAEVVPHPAVENNRDRSPGEADEADADSPPPHEPVNDFGLPSGCPVIPLGKNGKTFFYLDALQQLIPLTAKDHSRNNLAAMFSPWTDRTELLWPRKKLVKEKTDDGETLEKWITVGFKVEACGNDLMDACARRGIWDPQERVRGPGAWLDDAGRLIFHAGDVLWTQDGEQPTGALDRMVYPAYPPLPRPFDDVVPAGEQGPAYEVLEMLKSWNWQRSDNGIDPTLMLGWIGAAMVGGALDWRPMVFITGDKASGKSTIHKLLKYLFDGAIIQTADTSAAGLYQHVGHGSLPIAIDEIEAESDNRKARAVIRLARLASSGAVMLRGGAEHKGVEFQARSCFLFSAILMPPLEPQDRSRMAILRLGTLTRGRTPPVLEPGYFRELGRQLRRRMFDHWGRFEQTLALYTQALGKAKHDARGCDQFGTLLACADLLLYDQVPDTDTLDQWTDWLDASNWRELSETKSNAESCLDYLCQSQPEAYRGGTKQSVAALVAEQFETKNIEGFGVGEVVKAALASGGLALVNKRKVGKSYLAVPDTHLLVAKLFEGTAWAGSPGVAGGWSEALARLPGALLSETAKVDGRAYRCTLLPIALILPDKEDQSAQRADAAST